MKEFLITLCIIYLVIVVTSGNCLSRTSRYNVFANDSSLELCAKKIEENPGNAELYLDRAAVYASIEEFDKAIADYKKALEIDPHYHMAYERCGMTYIHKGEMAKNKLVAKTNYEKAIAFYNLFMEKNSQDEEAYYERGFAYHRLANCAQEFVEAKNAYGRAITDYSKSIALNKKYQKSYICRADIFMETGQYDEAIADYTYLADVYGLQPAAYYKLGSAYAFNGAYEQALAAYDEAINMRPSVTPSSYTDAYEERGKIYFRFKKYDEAITDFTQMVAKWEYEATERIGIPYSNFGKHIPKETEKQKCAEAHYLRALVYYEKGEYDKAHTDCARALERYPDHADARILEGKLRYIQRGEYEKIAANYTYLANAEGSSATYCKLAFVYILGGKYEKALAAYSKAIKEQQKYQDQHPFICTEAYEERGKIYLRLKKYDEAIIDFTHVINDWEYKSTQRKEDDKYLSSVENTPKEIDKLKCAETCYLRALAYYEMGEYDKAFIDCARTLEFVPDHADARILKGKLYKVLSKS